MVYYLYFVLILYLIGYILCRIILFMKPSNLSGFLKTQRKINGLTQKELALKAGVGLRFIRDIEQGKTTLRMDKVNLVLKLFGFELTPLSLKKFNQKI